MAKHASLACLVLLAACEGPSTIVGTWRDEDGATLTFRGDTDGGTLAWLAMREDPASLPPGCVEVTELDGTYAIEDEVITSRALAGSITRRGCDDPSDDGPGGDVTPALLLAVGESVSGPFTVDAAQLTIVLRTGPRTWHRVSGSALVGADAGPDR